MLYHTCFTRNDDRTRILVNLDTGKQCTLGMTEDPFWDRKLYNELKRQRIAKKAANEHKKKDKNKKKNSL